MEEWRRIVNPKYKDYYWVNTDGIVKSTYGGKDKIIARRLDADGYVRVALSRLDGSRVAVKTHILVAEAFLEKPENDEELEVSHLDDNRANSKLSNLE